MYEHKENKVNKLVIDNMNKSISTNLQNNYSNTFKDTKYTIIRVAISSKILSTVELESIRKGLELSYRLFCNITSTNSYLDQFQLIKYTLSLTTTNSIIHQLICNFSHSNEARHINSNLFYCINIIKSSIKEKYISRV